jgi:outer membrane protein TolC
MLIALFGVGIATATMVIAQPPIEISKLPGDVPKAKGVSEAEAAPKSILQPGEMPIDLESALKLAGVENPELLLARSRITELDAQRQLAVAQLLPNINIGTNYDAHVGPLQQSNGNILNVNRDAMYLGLGANATAAGTVNIPGLSYNMNVGEAWYGYLVSRQRVRTTRLTAEAVNNEVLLRVCLGYLELLRGDARRVIAAKNRDEAAELARVTKVFAEKGQGRQADANRAAVELRKREYDFTQAEADTLAASARLAQLLNLDPSTRLKPIDGWAVPTPVVPNPITLPELIAIAMLQRPELQSRRSEIQSLLYELSLAKVLPFSPNVMIGFSAGGFGGGSNLVADSPGFINGSGVLTTGPRFSDLLGRSDLDVVVYWTFRNMGVGNLAMIRAADSRVQQMRLREKETLNTVRAEVAEAKFRIDARYRQIEAAEKAVRSSTEAFTEDLKRTKGGVGLPLEVIDSLRLQSRSRFEYLDAIIDYNRAQFQLYVYLGKPPAAVLSRPVPADLVPPPMIEMKPGPYVIPIPRILPSPLPPVKP